MTLVLKDSDRVRLIKLLGMTGSAHDGEVANAAMAADRLVRQAGLTWHDVLQPSVVRAESMPEPKPRPSTYTWRPARDWRTLAADCLRRRHALSEWEVTFLTNVTGFRVISDKQRKCLNNITLRLLGEKAA